MSKVDRLRSFSGFTHANPDTVLRELIRLRQGRGLSQAAVANLMGVPQSVVSRLEAAENSDGVRKPTLMMIQRYAVALSCEVRLALLK